MTEVEMIDRVERRRKWSEAEKAALLAEMAAGGKVALVARRHGISESLLYNWRAAVRAAASTRPIDEQIVRIDYPASLDKYVVQGWAYVRKEPNSPHNSR